MVGVQDMQMATMADVHNMLQGVSRSMRALYGQNRHLGETVLGGQFAGKMMNPLIAISISQHEEQRRAFSTPRAKRAALNLGIIENRRFAYLFWNNPTVLTDLQLQPREDEQIELLMPYQARIEELEPVVEATV